MTDFNSKLVFGEMKIDSDNLKAMQIAKIKFLPSALDGLKELKPKLCIEQRLDGLNGKDKIFEEYLKKCREEPDVKNVKMQ